MRRGRQTGYGEYSLLRRVGIRRRLPISFPLPSCPSLYTRTAHKHTYINIYSASCVYSSRPPSGWCLLLSSAFLQRVPVCVCCRSRTTTFGVKQLALNAAAPRINTPPFTSILFFFRPPSAYMVVQPSISLATFW
jgi:hypothetical protein